MLRTFPIGTLIRPVEPISWPRTKTLTKDDILVIVAPSKFPDDNLWVYALCRLGVELVYLSSFEAVT